MPRPRKVTPALLARIRKMVMGGMLVADVAREVGISHQTIQRALDRDPDYQREVEAMQTEELRRSRAAIKFIKP